MQLGLIYKLAEVVSIDNDSIQFRMMLHPGPLEYALLHILPSEATNLMKKISSWPKALGTFNNSHSISEPSGVTVPDLTSQPASLQLLHALLDTNGQKLAAKIHHNILIAAAHIAYIKEHHVNGDHVSNLPNISHLTSQCVLTFISLNLMHSIFCKRYFSDQLKANLSDIAGRYISSLCNTSSKPNSLQFPLQLALLISPL